MASGCNPSIATSVLKPVPDTTVIYTGPPIAQFGICTGDTLSEIEAVILGKIVDYSTGVGINIPSIDLTQCDCFKSAITCCATACQSLLCILQAYLDCMCALYADVQILNTKVDAIYDGPYDTACLKGVSAADKFPAIFQEVIYELCTAETDITNIKTQLTNLTTTLPTTIGNFLLTAIKGCQSGSIVKTGTGASASIVFSGFVPLGGIIMYAGAISGVFDSTGLGVSPGPACGFALANGNNSTIDMRGYKPVGVNDGSMGGGGQNSEVNNATNPGQNYAINDHGGAIKVALSSAMCSVPPHTHTVTDPGHSHILAFGGDTFSGSKFSNMVKFDGNNLFSTLDGTPDVGNIHIKIKNNFTGITIGAASGSGTGSGTPHENRDPYRALYFVQRIA